MVTFLELARKKKSQVHSSVASFLIYSYRISIILYTDIRLPTVVCFGWPSIIKKHCFLCLEEFSDRPTQQDLLKGLNNLIRISEEQEKTDLSVYLKNLKQSDALPHVHKDCRWKVTDTRRQSTTPFPAKKPCFSVTVTFD